MNLISGFDFGMFVLGTQAPPDLKTSSSSGSTWLPRADHTFIQKLPDQTNKHWSLLRCYRIDFFFHSFIINIQVLLAKIRQLSTQLLKIKISIILHNFFYWIVYLIEIKYPIWQGSEWQLIFILKVKFNFKRIWTQSEYRQAFENSRATSAQVLLFGNILRDPRGHENW